jgi:cell division protein ZapA (FtsZ GTPase activity inhibitor)
MDTLSLREKAALCLRIASQLSWNNPSRLQLTDLADRLDRQAKEIELQNHPTQERSMAAVAAGVIRS